MAARTVLVAALFLSTIALCTADADTELATGSPPALGKPLQDLEDSNFRGTKLNRDGQSNSSGFEGDSSDRPAKDDAAAEDPVASHAAATEVPPVTTKPGVTSVGQDDEHSGNKTSTGRTEEPESGADKSADALENTKIGSKESWQPDAQVPVEPLVPGVDAGEALDATQFNGTSRAINDNGIRAFYAMVKPNLPLFQYATQAYTPGKHENRHQVYFCHVDSGFRGVGVTWFETGTGSDRASKLRRCYYAHHDFRTGKHTYQVTRVDQWHDWSILRESKSTSGASAYGWMSASTTMTNCWKTEANQAGADCPVVVANYRGDGSPGLKRNGPHRYWCRFTTSAGTVYGFTDLNKRGSGANDWEFPWCAAISLESNGRPKSTITVRSLSAGFDVLVFNSGWRDVNRKLEPKATSCGGNCRAVANFPKDHWPGLAGNDLSEGVWVFAPDVATCCKWCRETLGCYGFMFTGKNYNRCWMKTTNCFSQISPRPENKCFSLSPTNQCGAEREVSYNAIIRTSAPTNADFNMQVPASEWSSWKDNWDLAGCNPDLIAFANSIRGCHDACKNFNRGTLWRDFGEPRAPTGESRCGAWTYFKVEGYCYLRRAWCNNMQARGVAGLGKVSAIIKL